MKTQIYQAYDEQEQQNTIITENEYGYMILGKDQNMHQIDECWAKYFILIRNLNHEL